MRAQNLALIKRVNMTLNCPMTSLSTILTSKFDFHLSFDGNLRKKSSNPQNGKYVSNEYLLKFKKYEGPVTVFELFLKN